MSDDRPFVAANVVAQAIDGAPDRVRRRLDRTPDAAAEWKWSKSGRQWKVSAGNETVEFPSATVDSIEQVSCSCLLSPNCFHVMACLTSLEVAAAAPESESNSQPEPIASIAVDDDKVIPSEQQVAAAKNLSDSIDRMMRVGVTGAGVTITSGLLRAVHQCRASGLHRAASIGTRIVEGIRQVRHRSESADPESLARDIADALLTLHRIADGEAVENYWIGTARRKQYPINPKRLHGLLAEPVLTRSGFAGVAVYFLGEDGQIYSASDVRPGDAGLCRDAYRGGIEIGPIVEPARTLARSRYIGSGLTASRDGRLGKGKAVRVAAEGESSWDVPAVAKRFLDSYEDQRDRIHALTALPPDARPAGWDFLFLDGVIQGANGPDLVLQLDDESIIRLSIANDTPELHFRENLRLLAHAADLKVRVIGRLDVSNPNRVDALALQPRPNAENSPRLEVHEKGLGRIYLGLDAISRNDLVDVSTAPVLCSVHESEQRPDPSHLLGALTRRWVAVAIGGTSSQHRTPTKTIAREISHLHQMGFTTGASLLDAIARGDKNPTDTFLATSVYLDRCQTELART